MRLGTRWTAGDTPPASVPEALHQAIAQVDAELSNAGADQPLPRWTLTWLEGSAIAELDTGASVRIGPDGTAAVSYED